MISVSVSVSKSESVKYGIFRHFPNFVDGLVAPPDTVPVQDVPMGRGKGQTIKIFDSCWDLIRRINSDKGYGFARSVQVMWINIYYDDGVQIPKAEAIDSGGNFMAYDDETESHYHMLTFDYQMNFSALDHLEYNWYKHPELFFKATAIKDDGTVQNPGNALDVYLPRLRVTDRWVNKLDVEPFPELPCVVSLDGTLHTIVRYRLLGASVIGIDSVGNEIWLLRSTRPGERVFPTDWKLLTFGVIPPVV